MKQNDKKLAAPGPGIAQETDAQKPFVKRNFLYMGISLALIVAGFLLMTGSSNNDPAHFNEDIYSVRRIVIGPGLAFLGFVAMAVAIILSPAAKKKGK